MNIIHFLGMKSTKLGGIERFLLELVHINKEYTFVLVYDNHPNKAVASAFTQAGAIIEIVKLSGIGYITNFHRTLGLILKYRPIAVHFHFSNAYLLYPPFLKAFKVKKIIKTVHSCLLDRSGKQAKTLADIPLVQRIVSLWGRTIACIDTFVCVSEYTRKQICDVFHRAKSVQTVYLGCPSASSCINSNDCVDPQNNVGKTEFIISTIAFASPIKGVDVLFKALARLTNYRLYLVGLDEAHEYTKYLHKLAEDLCIDDKICWVGITNDVYSILSKTQLYVQPSRTEALSIACCEALSMGIPTIGADVGGLAESSLITFESENYVELSEIIKGLQNDSDYLKLLREKALSKFRNSFEMERGIESYTALYI